MKFYPYGKGGGAGNVLAMLKGGGGTKVEVLAILKGARKVKRGGTKSYTLS